jgi:uncharacterized protein
VTTIHLGRDNTAPLDVDALLETRLLIQANSGGGKSYTIRRLLEQTHGGVQHFVLDVEGDFGTLREQFDYALVGPEGDCPADPSTAGPLALKLLELGVSAIADISELTEPQRDEFVANFLQSLMGAPKRLWRPLLVVVDEAHKACPESRSTLAKPHVIDLMTRGRKRAFGAVLATQRVALLANTAIAEANNKLIGRCTLDTDIKRIADEVGFDKATRRELRTLQPGEFFAFGPALGADVQRVRIGDVETTHPRPGTTRNVALPPAPKSLANALAQLTELAPAPEYAAQMDPELLAEVDRLRARVAELESAPPPIAEDALDRLRVAMNVLQCTGIPIIETALKASWEVTAGSGEALPGYARGLVPNSAHNERPAPQPEPKKAPKPPRTFAQNDPRSVPDMPGKTPTMDVRVLTLCAQYRGKGMTRDRLALHLGMHPNTKTLTNAVGRLRTAGALEGLEITPLGLQQLGPYKPLPTGRALFEMWCRKFKPAETRVLLAIASRDNWDREGLAAHLGCHPNTKTLTNAVGKFRGLGLVEKLTLSRELR